MSKTTTEHVAPVPGAATYRAQGCKVWMSTEDGDWTCIDSKPSPESAQKAATRWQKKENAAVLKEQKRVEKSNG